MNLEQQLASLELRKSVLDREQLFFQLGKSQTSRLPQARAFLAGAVIAFLPWIITIPTPKSLTDSASYSQQVSNPVEKNPYSILALGYSLKQGNYPKPTSWTPKLLSQIQHPRKTDYSYSNPTNFWSNHENFS